MTQRYPVSLLEDFIDKELSRDEAARLEELIASSPELRAELESTKRLKELLMNHQTPDPGEDYFDGLTRIILARTSASARITPLPVTERQKLERRLFYRSLASAVASIALFICALWFGTMRQEQLAGNLPAQVIVASSLTEEFNIGEGSPAITRQERANFTTGAFLLSPPGLGGRFFDLHDVLGLK